VTFVDPGAPLEDRLRVLEAHARLNHLWAIHGIGALAALYGTPHGRTQTVGMDNGEVDRIIGGIRGFITGLPDDWLASWSRAGDEWDARAQDALDRGKHATAAGHGLIASMCHHVGEMMVYSLGEVPGRREAALRCAASFRKIADCFDPPAHRLDVPFGDTTLPGYLRLPTGVERSPVAILTGGANSVKEELHPVTDFLVRRGIATVCFEAPGQGEYFATTDRPLRAESFVRAVSAVIDALQADDRIDADRLAVFGRATSGLLVIRAAAVDRRIKAIVAHPGSYDWGTFFERQFPFYPSQLELFTVLGAGSIAEGIELIRSEFTLVDHIVAVEAQMLIVNSQDDRAIPVSEAALLEERAACEVDVVVFPGRAHGGPPALAQPLEADWLAERLRASA
jgi:2,6-dihydroxypseudooxynicotine hydrolase